MRNKPKILRLGGLDISSIKVFKKINYENNFIKITSPGQFKLHYSPGIPVRLNVKKPKKNEAFF